MYRLIIADDSVLECRALELKIRESLAEIELLPSVLDGVSLIQNVEKLKPDIAIVDINMPGLTGLETIEVLRGRQIRLKILIHTAYSEFAYARKALQLGAVDYLLKPCDAEQMIGALEKVCRILDEEKQFQESQKQSRDATGRLADLSGQKWLQSLLLRQPDPEGYGMVAGIYPELRDGGIFTAWKSVADNMEKAEETERQILEHVRRFCHCFGISYKNIFYLVLLPGKQEDYECWALDIVEDTGKLLKTAGIDVAVGISKYKVPGELENGLSESRIALQGREKAGVFFFQFETAAKNKWKLPEAVLSAVHALLEGKIEEALLLVEQAVACGQAACEEEFIQLKVQAAEFLLAVHDDLGMVSAKKERLAGCGVFREEFQKADCKEKVEKWLKNRLTDSFAALLAPEEENSYTEKAILYLQQHYGDDLSLSDVGGAIGISPFYLSRLLKQEMDTTFIEVLTDIRMQEAIRLLKEKQLSVKQICQKTGYVNLTYFYKVFKKSTGMTVGKVRRYL